MSSIQNILETTLLIDVMVKPVIAVRDIDDFHVVQDKMETFGIRHLPVVNDAGVLVGIITERYLYKIHSPRKLEDGSWHYDHDMLDSFILKNVMVKEPFTLRADNTLKDAMEAMIEHKYGCIVIVDDYKRPHGVITRGSILKFFLTQ